jgi:hypothetical protein
MTMTMTRLLILVLVGLGSANFGCGSDDAKSSDGGSTIDADTSGNPDVCNFLNCDGCCDGNVCNEVASKTSCGLNGRACKTCEGADECFSGSCAPPTTDCNGCEGCCLDGTQCLPGNDQAACGAQNDACVACPDGQGCEGGMCKAIACDATSCPDGCCTSNGQCVNSGEQSVSVCGKAGGACSSCPTNTLSCTLGTCVIDQPCLDFCTEGCCNTDGQCILYGDQSPAACALTGQCGTCDGTNSCVAGVCSPDQAWTITVRSAIIATTNAAGDDWDFFGNSLPDPYVAGALTDDLVVDWFTATIDNTITPNWNEEEGTYLESDLLAEGLQFNVNDSDGLGIFESIGNCIMTITLVDLNAGTKTQATCGTQVTNLIIDFAKQ